MYAAVNIAHVKCERESTLLHYVFRARIWSKRKTGARFRDRNKVAVQRYLPEILLARYINYYS